MLLTIPLRRMPAYIAAYVALIGTRNGPMSDAVGFGSRRRAGAEIPRKGEGAFQAGTFY